VAGERYDVSGVAPDRIQKIIEHDWIHLIHEQEILDSPNYLRESGKPVIAIWGTFLPILKTQLTDPHSPVRIWLRQFRSFTQSRQGNNLLYP